MNTDEMRDPHDLPESPEPADDSLESAADALVPESDSVSAPDEAVPAVPAPEVVTGEAAPVADEIAVVAESEESGAQLGEPADEAPAVTAAVGVESTPEAAAPASDAEPEPLSEYGLSQALFDAGIDVDAALGALSFELASATSDEEPAAPRLPPFNPPNYRPRLRMPRPITLRRGQIGSVLPAFILIGLGIWLTFANVTGAPVDPLLVGLVLVGGLILSFAAVWLAGGRWARGLLLLTLLVVVGGGGAALLLNAGVANALAAYPLLLSALGVAIVLAGLLARPVERAMLGPGIVFLAAGIVGFLVLNGAIPATIVSTAAAYWFVPAAIAVLLLLLPLIFRKPA